MDNFKFQFYDQPGDRPGPKVPFDTPNIYNLRQDPFERTAIVNFSEGATAYFNSVLGREAWRFVFAQQVVFQLGETRVEFPPMQAPASSAAHFGLRAAPCPGLRLSSTCVSRLGRIAVTALRAS